MNLTLRMVDLLICQAQKHSIPCVMPQDENWLTEFKNQSTETRFGNEADETHFVKMIQTLNKIPFWASLNQLHLEY